MMENIGKRIVSKSGTAAKRSAYIGVTKEGIKILRPTFPPKSFTEKQLQKAVAKALSKSA